MPNDYGEPWRTVPSSLSSSVYNTSFQNSEEKSVGNVDLEWTISWGHGDTDYADRLVACVNFLAGIPDEVLITPLTDVQRIALSVLAGAPDYALLDAMLEQRTT